MAQKHIVQLIDDLDEGSADETVSFSVDGSTYEIDLSTASNAAKLRDSLAPYVANARRAGARGARAPQRGLPRLVCRSVPAATASRPTRSASGRARTATRSATRAAYPARILEAYNSAGN